MFKNLVKTLTLVSLFLVTLQSKGQSIYDLPQELKAIVLEKDSLFWQAYNQCNVNKMISFLTEDLEFYHDKNGLTHGRSNFEKALNQGLCANGPQLRREAIKESVQVFPLKGIGAIISGQHTFYIGDRPDGLAKFTHIWRFSNGTWKMSRVLSYDHLPVPYENQRIAISLGDQLLHRYSGDYLAPQTGEVVFTKLDGKLKMTAGPMELILSPEKENLFFHDQSNLTFEFISNEKSEVQKVIIRENGQIVEEAKRKK